MRRNNKICHLNRSKNEVELLTALQMLNLLLKAHGSIMELQLHSNNFALCIAVCLLQFQLEFAIQMISAMFPNELM